MLGIGNSLALNSLQPEITNFSLAFDGNDYIDLGTPFQSTIRGSFSVSLWVRLDDSTPSSGAILFSSSDSPDHFNISLNATSQLWVIQFSANGQGTTGDLYFSTGLSGNDPSSWINLCVTVVNNGGSNLSTLKLYINGSHVGTKEAGLIGTNHSLFASTNNVFCGNGLVGKMDDIAIWSSALNGTNVTKVYNSGSPFDLTSNNGDYNTSGDLVGYWKMNENTGTTVADSSTNSNNASFQGDPQWDSSTP